jgi:hypothetical protein
MNKCIRFIILSSILISSTGFAATRKVLFIGNSYIYTNNMPEILRQLALSLGDTLIYDQSVPGGHTLQAHSTNATTINKIYSQQWDVVVIHDQSQRPAFPPAQVATDTYPYARILDSLVHDNYACSQTMFMMTWGYKNGDPSNCTGYPVICTYEGMQMRLRESYLQMTQDNNATVAPVGAAWKVARDSFPAIELYSNDNSHPVVAGSYLEACVLYASIFHKSPAASYYSTVPSADAMKLQGVARHVVLDSLDNWQQHGNYTFADFGLSINDKTITLVNNSDKATSYAWNFGDLSTSTQMSPAPHTYTQYGQYTITLTSSNSCFSEMSKRTIDLYPLSVSTIANGTDINIYAEAQGSVIIANTKDYSKLEIYNVNGQKVHSFTVGNGENIRTELTPGIYLCYAYNGNITSVIKFSVN